MINIATHTENNETLVLYCDKDNLWARPLQMFLEIVEINGQKVPRFEFLTD